jgi:hypothetical protein
MYACCARSVWLIKPSEGLSTPEVFRNLVDYDLLSKEDPKELLASFYQEVQCRWNPGSMGTSFLTPPIISGSERGSVRQ